MTPIFELESVIIVGSPSTRGEPETIIFNMPPYCCIPAVVVEGLEVVTGAVVDEAIMVGALVTTGGAVVVVTAGLAVVAAVVCVVDAGRAVVSAVELQAAKSRPAIMTTANRKLSFLLINNLLIDFLSYQN